MPVRPDFEAHVLEVFTSFPRLGHPIIHMENNILEPK